MTNDLLDNEGTGTVPEPQVNETPDAEENAAILKLLETPLEPEAPEDAEESEEEPFAGASAKAPASAPEEPTVFSPSPWDRRRDRVGETAARQAEKEAQRQEKAAQREAQRLEKKIAQEQKKAQEDARRQEAREREEERRQEARRRAEEKREEKAQGKRVRRVGTMTLGVSLIAIGVAILVYMINPSFDIRLVAYLAPVILICMGAEILIRYFFSKDRTYKYDFASGLICILLVIGSFGISLLPYVVYYIGPERFASEEELLNAEREKVYQAFRGDQRVRDYHVSGGVEHSLATVRRDENDRWVYELQYLYTSVNLLDPSPSAEEFAQTCRELLDKMEARGVTTGENGCSFSISFRCGENEDGVSYSLDIYNRLQMEMNAGNLSKLVDATYSRPNRENGWYPGGYDEIKADFGTEYAEQFATLVDRAEFTSDDAMTYYNILYEYGPDAARSYYEGLVAKVDSISAPEPESEVMDTPGEEETPEVPEATVPQGDDETGEPVPAAGEESVPAEGASTEVPGEESGPALA